MNNVIVRFLIDFAFIFVIVLLVYLLIINRKKKDYGKLKDRDLIKSFIRRYDLDMRKTEYKKVLNIMAINSSFVIAFTSSLVLNIKGTLLKIIVSLVVILILTYTLFEITGKYLKNKEEKNV